MSEKIAKIEEAMWEVMGEGVVIYGEGKWNCDKELATIKALHELNKALYEEDDFKASCMAYMYILPRIQAFLRYILRGEKIGIEILPSRKVEYRYIENVGLVKYNELREWRLGSSDICKVRRKDGSEKSLLRDEYLYKEIREKEMAIAARYFIHWNIQYLEKQKKEMKSYPTRQRVLKSAVWWFNQMLLTRFGLSMPDAPDWNTKQIIPKLIIFSTFPSSGKSFLCNTLNEMFSALGQIYQKKGGVLRVSNEEGNINRQSRQTMSLILNPLFLDIYPEFREYVSSSGTYSPFEKSSQEEWGLKGCEYEPCTSIFKTRDSAINSIRCQIGMFDDPSRGLQECNNIEKHKQIGILFNGDFMDRFESPEHTAIILTGTMFNPFDVFSTEIQKALENGAIQDNRFDNTFLSKDLKTIVIANDCEDEQGNSAYPEFISNEALDKKRRSLPAYEYHCIWRQRPIPAEGLIFSADFLSFYDELPPIDELSPYSFATIDPTRRTAKDFFSMPIFKYHAKSGKFYLIDIIYEKKSILQLYDKVVSKIITHSIIKVGYEENIDTSLGTTLTMKLNAKGEADKWCKLEQIYSTKNKQQRIADLADTIKMNIVFPSVKYANTRTQLGFAVHQLQEYDGDSKGHDDFPDSLAMFADKFIVNNKRENSVKSYKTRPF